MIHTIAVQAWGDRAALVCLECNQKAKLENGVSAPLLRADTAAGLSMTQITEAIEEHTGEAAFRASVGGQPVPGSYSPPEQERLATEEDLVAYGPVDEFPEGYHPRTGQRLDPEQ